MDIDFPELQRCIKADVELQAKEKEELLALDEHDFAKSMVFGGAGAAVGLIVSKYLKLAKTTQVILSLAGFGIGRVLYNSLIKNPDRDNFGKVNKTKQYEIN